jgi:hypothetical protein
MSREANPLTGNSLTGVARVGFWDEVSIRSIATEPQSPYPNYGNVGKTRYRRRSTLTNGKCIPYARLFLALTACRITDKNALISNHAIEKPPLPDLQKISICSIPICTRRILEYVPLGSKRAIHPPP